MSAPIPSDVAEVIRNYSAAWWSGQNPSAPLWTSDFRPAEWQSELLRRLLVHNRQSSRLLESLTKAYESKWKAGGRPRIEDVLRKYCAAPETEKRQRLGYELLLREIRVRFALGETPRVEEYLARLPEELYREPVARAFSEATQAFARRFQIQTLDAAGEPEILLSRGGQAEVLLGYDGELGRAIAIKRGLDRKDDARLRREAKTLARLSEAQVPAVYGIGNDPEGRLCIAMHLITDGTAERDDPDAQPVAAVRLADRLARFHGSGRGDARRRNPEFLEIVAKFIAVARTLARAHGHPFRILHRDLKPDNILLDGADQPFVIDWGLAIWLEKEAVARECGGAIVDEMTTVSSGGGTPGYLSREQARGEKPTPATDVFGLGACLFQLMTGLRVYDCTNPWWKLGATLRRPIRPGTPDAAKKLMRRAERYRRAPNPRRIHGRADAELCAIVRKAIEPVPADRYPSADELAKALEDWIRDTPPRFPAGGRLARKRFAVGRWVRRNTGVFLLVSISVVVLGAIAGTWIANERHLGRTSANSKVELDRAAAVDKSAALYERLSELVKFLREIDLRGWRADSPSDSLGKILELLGEFEAAASKSRELDPERGDYSGRVSEVRTSVAELHKLRGQLETAAALLRVDLDKPFDSRRESTIACCARAYAWWKYGDIVSDVERRSDAIEAYTRAFELLSEVPPNFLYQKRSVEAWRARMLGYRGDSHLKSKDYFKAHDDYRDSLLLRQDIHSRDPESPVAREDLAHAHNNIARLRRTDRHGERTAGPMATILPSLRAIQLFQSNPNASAADPAPRSEEQFDALGNLADTWIDLGDAHRLFGSTARATSAYDEAERLHKRADRERQSVSTMLALTRIHVSRMTLALDDPKNLPGPMRTPMASAAKQFAEFERLKVNAKYYDSLAKEFFLGITRWKCPDFRTAVFR